MKRLWGTAMAAVLAASTPAVAEEPSAAAAHANVPTVRGVRAQASIILDGKLDDAVWTEAPPAGGFRQRDPQEGTPATEATELRVAYDDEALYLGLRMHDREPGQIIRRLSRRDEDFDADRVSVYLDPHHDHLSGVLLQVSAAGVQADSVLYNDSWDDSSWDAVWESAVSVDESGWSVEMRVPFSQLRFPESAQHTWGINVRREIRRKNETDWLELVPKKESGVASRMAHLVGLDGIRPRRSLELLPYAVARGELVEPSSAADPFNDGSRTFGAVGVDLKYGLSSSLTLNATLNPDFGQVEVDPAVVNLTEFETFFDEKRPFFVEGSQLFGNFGRNGANNFWGFNRSEPILFYSRRIGRHPQGSPDADFADSPSATTILGAAKLTGKTTGGWSLGVIEAVTARERAQTMDLAGHREHPQIEPFTNYLVARAHREGKRAGIGALATAVNRRLADPEMEDLLVGQAYVAGLDGYYFLRSKKDWVMAGRLAGSWLYGGAESIDRIQRAPQRYFQRPDTKEPRLEVGATDLSGWTGSLNLNRNSGNVQANAALWAVSPGFESSDLGFNFKADRWGGHALVTFRKTDPDRYTRERSFTLAKWYALNFDGERQGDGIHGFFNGQLRNYWYVGGNGFYRFRCQNDQLTRGGPSVLAGSGWGAGGWVESDSRKRVQGVLEHFFNYTEHDSRYHSTFASLQLKPSSSVKLSFGPGWQRSRTAAQYVETVDDPLATATYGQRYVFGVLKQTEVSMTTRVNWILSPRMSLQAYIQPLVSVGDYEEFKELARPRTFDFLRYGTEAGTLARPAGGGYQADPDGPGPAPAFSFSDPNFNFKSLRVNLVFRWEWRLGSTLYVVWTQQRENSDNPGHLRLGRDAADLLQAPADDVLLVKVSYRLGK
jgi:hypothetical protein